MKFTKAVLAAALASTASAQNCAVKSGQIEFIQPLTSAWKLYNNQVAFNAVVDEKLSNTSDAKAAKDAAISAHHAGVATGINDASVARTAAVGVEHTDAQTDLVAKHDAQKLFIETTYQASINAAQEAHDARQGNLDTAIASENQRVIDSAAADVIKADGVGAAAAAKRAEANADAAAVHVADAASVAAKLAVEDTRDADIRVRYGVTSDAQVAALNAKYAGIHNEIEANKYDTAATLAELDTAGAGGIAYDADCIVDVATAIAGVKADKKAGTIWNEFIN